MIDQNFIVYAIEQKTLQLATANAWDGRKLSTEIARLALWLEAGEVEREAA